MKKAGLLALLMLAGCTAKPVFSPEEGKAVAQACIESTGAPGVYSITPGRPSSNPASTLPNARAVETLGGTRSGQEAINACIQRQAPTSSRFEPV